MPASSESSAVSKKLRVYVPATVPMLRELVADREIRALNDTAFAVTPALREAYASGDDEELAEVAMAEAARASLRLLAQEQEAADLRGSDESDSAPAGPIFRRAVIAADVDGATLRPDLDDAVVRLSAAIPYDRIASIHVDLAEAESEVSKAVGVIDAADMGDTDAEFVLGDAEDHQLAWYAAQELPFLLDLL
ncbi:DUF6912 family protein [Nocardia sp. NPDC059240]|uniref:DUF6912 family protein n=1 Tax=Nocardia sp. NPDC059240 TaxID=3346786 RepID=UPI0036AD8C1F